VIPKIMPDSVNINRNGRSSSVGMTGQDQSEWAVNLGRNTHQAGTGEQPYYTNSSQLPVGYTDDPFQALEMQEALQTRYTGGTVLHLYLGEQISSADACRRLVRRALEKFRQPYITVTPTFSICPTHGYLGGEQEFCPKCDDALLANKQS